MPGDIWVIDTSSILEIRRDHDKAQLQIPKGKQPGVYSALGALVDQGVLVYPAAVLRELERQAGVVAATGKRDLPFEWAKKNAEQGTRFARDYVALREVLEYSGMEKLIDYEAKGGAEAADPWILALAFSLNKQGYATRVITEDRNNLPDKVALASACGIVNVATLRVGAFLLHKQIPTK